MSEKVALLDVCDVAVDLHNVTIEMAKLDLPPHRITDWDLFKLVTPDEKERILTLYDDPEFWRHLPPVPHVHEGIEALRSQGYRIHWVTSPWFSCKDWEGIRRAWLNEQFNTGPLEVTFTPEKYRFDGDLLVDDRPKHIKLWSEWRPERAGRAHLFDSPFNRHFEWASRVRWSKDGLTAVNAPGG